MPNNQPNPKPKPSATASGVKFMLLTVLLGGLVVLAFIFLTRRSGPETTASPLPPSTARATKATTTTIAEENLVSARLREILRVRDRAYRQRDVSLLSTIYTTDCPCLRGDVGAIEKLLEDDAVWVGASTSVHIRKFDKENDRLWIVVATFVGSPFRIETETGDLIRSVERQSELFRFVLTRTSANDDILLGFAGPVGGAGG